MNRCRLCLTPDTRPDTHFVDGICSACISYKQRDQVDWEERKRQLEALLEQGRNGSGYDCIVPSSGGKDSHAQVMYLLKLGAKPLIVTASTCQLTPIGRANLDNLARYATTIEVSPNKTVRAKLNRLGFELVGDISWPEHVAIFTTPIRIAAALGIPLVFYGENPQEAYGGPPEADRDIEMTRRWVTEFGGQLGLRPRDLVGKMSLTEHDLADYVMPDAELVKARGVRAYFLGKFVRWDSWENARVAIAAGMQAKLPTPANAWGWENLDNAQTGLHDHLMFRKYGYGRMTMQLSVDIRSGHTSRGEALAKVHQHDGTFPWHYAGVAYDDVLARIGMSVTQAYETMDGFTNWDLFDTDAGKYLRHKPRRVGDPSHTATAG
ncbi:MAG TPA: N-acetyl sugar amidotransferase [Gemmatimonadales bacterium]